MSDSEACEGYYADIDNDGVVDGKIYADLAHDMTNDTEDSGTFSWEAGDNFKSYYVSRNNYKGYPVLAPLSTNGNDRFYVMSLDQITTENGAEAGYDTGGNYYWFHYGNISDPSQWVVAETENDFGTGKAKTIAMKKAWDDETYGDKYESDIWNLWDAISGENTISSDDGRSYNMVENTYDSAKWFIPSKSELAAYRENTSKYTYDWWSSSLSDESYAYYATYRDEERWNKHICAKSN